ncbi:uncharacterized protein [Porites lutea]|uniref:uncharacterized protein isoform X1 n=1 Tax=Porites lutea TaxID=51062 RepID=UPI003CC624DC
MSDKQQLLVLLIILGGSSLVTVAFECTAVKGYDGCACYVEKNNTKIYVNLLPLKENSSIPRFTVKDKDSWFISYSPCGVFSEFVNKTRPGVKSCVDVSVARWTNESVLSCESLGNDANSEFVSSVAGDVGGNVTANLTLKFRSRAAEHHSAVISLVCNETLPENETVFEYINTVNIPTDTYYLALTSKCCCPGKCGTPPALPTPPTKPTGSLKTWEIIVIAAACVVVLVLIVVGMVWYYGKKKPGYEAV